MVGERGASRVRPGGDSDTLWICYTFVQGKVGITYPW